MDAAALVDVLDSSHLMRHLGRGGGSSVGLWAKAERALANLFCR